MQQVQAEGGGEEAVQMRQKAYKMPEVQMRRRYLFLRSSNALVEVATCRPGAWDLDELRRFKSRQLNREQDQSRKIAKLLFCKMHRRGRCFFFAGIQALAFNQPIGGWNNAAVMNACFMFRCYKCSIHKVFTH